MCISVENLIEKKRAQTTKEEDVEKTILEPVPEEPYFYYKTLLSELYMYIYIQKNNGYTCSF